MADVPATILPLSRGLPTAKVSRAGPRAVPRLPFRGKPAGGNGYLAGEFPGGTTTVDGEPISALVRILYRPENGALGDGVVVATTTSSQDGTWRVDGLNPALKFDVVGRKEGFNDVIMSSVSPEVD